MTNERKFPDFLDAYFEFSQDGFCPDPFHFWMGVSVIAGTLERKVWIPWSNTLNFYPNLYILLVSNPGMGKSSAGNIGVNGLMRHIKGLKFIPAQVTEAKLIDLMTEQTSFNMGTKQFFQSAGYFYASEASNSLKNIYGDFIACITDFYDCPAIWEKATKKDDRTTITNICFNMLAGCTFDYLGKLITDDNIMGGFASRLLYIIYDEKKVRPAAWGSLNKKTEEVRMNLLHDLNMIHRMTGPFHADDEFRARWLTWFPLHDKARQEIKSEKLQSIMVRESTNIMKLCMICAASESNEMILRARHWDRALKLVEGTKDQLPKMLRMSQAQSGVNPEQRSINMTIMEIFGSSGVELPLDKVVVAGVSRGYPMFRVKDTVVAMINGGELSRRDGTDGKSMLTLRTDPNNYL